MGPSCGGHDIGTKGKKPMWADFGLRPVIGSTVDIKVAPQPLEDREVDLLLSCWRKWDHKSVLKCALNTWLTGVDPEYGPDCQDSPHFRRPSIDCFEMVQLLEKSGFGFLPEADLQNQPLMEKVMTVGLRLCALEFTSKQLKVLAYLTVSGLLPESFPHSRWVMAVQRSFSTQEAAVCKGSAEWEDVRRILELVQTANVTVESSNGTTLWTRDSVCVPVPQEDEYPLRLLVHPPTRDQSHLPDVLHVEATGLGGRDLGYPEKWDISLRSDPEGQHEQEVELRGFSAGSFAGLCLLHILWPIPGVATKGKLGAIACPPALLTMGPAKEGDKLHLIHYESDELCCWRQYTYIMNESSAYKGRFGAADHGYSHWLWLDLPGGILQLSQLLFLRPEAAASAKRDETPLRLISWLNYQLDSDIESFIEKAMHHLSTREHHDGPALLQLGKQQVKLSDQVRTETDFRDRLIDRVSVGNLRRGALLPLSKVYAEDLLA